MKKVTESVTEIMAKCCNMGDALDMLGYSMEALYYIDNGEAELRKMLSQITGGIECLKAYHSIIYEDLEVVLNDLFEDEDEPPEMSQKDKEERLLWVYRHMSESDKGQLDRYCNEFHLAD
ncbi:MAG: hypothetical protein NC548_60090 [Lachnospiraceae bacterium]|nr:hypothetical protein [Lachnospiraceae bacterium]